MKIAVALSGGVDSAVVLGLVSEYHNVHAFTMKLWDDSCPESLKNSCFGYGKQEDIDTCEKLCQKFNVPYTVIDLSKQFRSTVLDEFTSNYEKGITPNPCVTCNKKIKFGLFMEKIKEIYDFDLLATGHYADIVIKKGDSYLKRIEDNKKDQTYFLWQLPPNVLKKLWFPLPSVCKNKEEVRNVAFALGIEIANKKDSMSFADGKYIKLFSKESVESSIGNFVYYGTPICKHKGIVNYTIGQRAKISGLPSRLYVKRIDTESKDIEVDVLHGVTTKSINFSYFSGRELLFNNTELFIKLKQEGGLLPIRSIRLYPNMVVNVYEDIILTPGQSCVIYNSEGLLLGGGIINFKESYCYD